MLAARRPIRLDSFPGSAGSWPVRRQASAGNRGLQFSLRPRIPAIPRTRANGGALMQRDIDLLRHLLLEIERRGATAPIDSLRADTRHDGDDRVRYHLRLLTDAGYL